MPPSKALGDPLHDDRLTRMLLAVRPAHEWEVRELLVQDESVPPSHQAAVGERPGPQEIAGRYRIDENRSTPEPSRILMVDDVLTTGAHFAAAKSVLSNRFPQAAVVGLFVARRVPGGGAGSGW